MFTFDGEKGKHNDALKIPPTSINLYTKQTRNDGFAANFDPYFTRWFPLVISWFS